MSATVAPSARLAPAAHHDAPAPPRCIRPFVGIAAVLLGALISTLYGRITTFGLADLRGAVHAGFDEGAWITTAATVGQMAIGPVSAWLGLVFGVRRVLMVSATVFALTSVLIPYAPGLPALLIGQAIGGLSSGTFIPLTIGFVLQSLPPTLWPYGIAAYGLSLELSLNIPASLEGWYLDNLTWHWIFWQGTILAVPMVVCIYFGMPRQPINRDGLRNADFWGMFFASSGFSVLYAALDQGNRLDWLNSGVVSGLLVCGGLLILAFIVQELTAEHPWINLSFLLRRNIALMVMIIVMYRFIILSTSYLIPQYLTTLQNFRSLQVGDVLLWIAVPQFILAPLIAWMLQYIDPRYVLALGVTAVGIACLMASNLTAEWATGDFLPSQNSAGVRAIRCFDLRGAVRRSPSAARRRPDVWCGAADRSLVWRRAGQCVHANLCARTGAGAVEPVRAARRAGRLSDAGTPFGIHRRRPCTFRRAGGGIGSSDVPAGPGRAQPGQRIVLYRWVYDRIHHRHRNAWAGDAASGGADPAGGYTPLNSPDLPPALCTRRTASIRMPRSIDLHMS